VYLNSKLIQETKNELNKFYGEKKAVM
jgi:hypothetical protein